MIHDLTAERVTRFRTALEEYTAAIAADKPRTVLDALQDTVFRYRVPGVVGDAIIPQKEFTLYCPTSPHSRRPNGTQRQKEFEL